MSALHNLNDTQVLALMGYAEARGEGYDGIVAVMQVAQNRRMRRGMTISAVVLEPRQFSCFNSDDPQYQTLVALAGDWPAAMKAHKWLRACLWLAGGVISRDFPPIVDGATHYHEQTITPHWAPKMKFVKQIGRHLFYEEPR